MQSRLTSTFILTQHDWSLNIFWTFSIKLSPAVVRIIILIAHERTLTRPRNSQIILSKKSGPKSKQEYSIMIAWGSWKKAQKPGNIFMTFNAVQNPSFFFKASLCFRWFTFRFLHNNTRQRGSPIGTKADPRRKKFLVWTTRIEILQSTTSYQRIETQQSTPTKSQNVFNIV